MRTKIKKINLPSYRDDRVDRPVHIVRDSDASQSSKTNTLSATKRLTESLQQRSEDLQVIPSDREEDHSIEALPSNTGKALNIFDRQQEPKTIKYRKVPKGSQGPLNYISDDSKMGYGVDHNQEANMFNME